MRQDKFRGNIFVANLPDGFTDEKLASVFDAYGLVIGAFLARDLETGQPKNHGLVALAPDNAAKAAVAELNGSEVEGRRIEVRPADPNMALAVRSRPQRPAGVFRQTQPRTTGAVVSRPAVVAYERPVVPVRTFTVEHRKLRPRP